MTIVPASYTEEEQALRAERCPLRLGDIIPDFTADTTQGAWSSFHDFLGNDSWTIIFSHPSAFTPVCTTELAVAAQMSEEWERRNTKLVALACNSVQDHERWIRDIASVAGCKVNFPIIADESRNIAALLGMLDSAEHDPTNIDPKSNLPFTVRSLFVLDPRHRIRLILSYPASCGRNFDEILRTLDSLQITDQHHLITPANWTPDMPCIVPPTMSTEEAHMKYSNVKERLPYLREAEPAHRAAAAEE